ncbi:VMO1 protein, partial [Polypterus senegalus]
MLTVFVSEQHQKRVVADIQSRCVQNIRATGAFSSNDLRFHKVQGSQVKGDNTALNGIRLFCKESAQASIVRSIESGTGQWGSWTSTQWCSEGFLKAFLLQVETHQKGGDDTAANDIIFICSNGTVLAGHGQAWGNWGSQSNACERGISSIRTKVEQPTGDGDETALNDVRFFCH